MRPRLQGLILSSVCIAGCGPSLYTAKSVQASRTLAQAQEAGAPDAAPYEYEFAKAHLDKAREEAGESAYQDAVRHAKKAQEYARRALNAARVRAPAPGVSAPTSAQPTLNRDDRR